jgi:hypothetical protein
MQPKAGRLFVPGGSGQMARSCQRARGSGRSPATGGDMTDSQCRCWQKGGLLYARQTGQWQKGRFVYGALGRNGAQGINPNSRTRTSNILTWPFSKEEVRPNQVQSIRPYIKGTNCPNRASPPYSKPPFCHFWPAYRSTPLKTRKRNSSAVCLIKRPIPR